MRVLFCSNGKENSAINKIVFRVKVLILFHLLYGDVNVAPLQTSKGYCNHVVIVVFNSMENTIEYNVKVRFD